MAPTSRRLLNSGIILFSLFAAVKLTPARTQESLEKKVETLHYGISCPTRLRNLSPQIGDANFSYSQENGRYNITTDVETTGFILSILFSGKYNFTTKGIISDKSFLPESYTFIKKDSSGNNLVKVIQTFDFREYIVTSSRYENGKKDYVRPGSIDQNTRDILSALMELRTRPLQSYTFQIIEDGSMKPFTFVYLGEKKIMVGKKEYMAYEFSVEDERGCIINSGQKVFLYLAKNAQRTLLKVYITNHKLGDVSVDLDGKKESRHIH